MFHREACNVYIFYKDNDLSCSAGATLLEMLTRYSPFISGTERCFKPSLINNYSPLFSGRQTAMPSLKPTKENCRAANLELFEIRELIIG